ncbi:AraC family transcriptional regulator [Devosia sp. XJ19-1]|uniref:AraC family transcriptional regulator n=1 Tax=Devosia ureilytica TaxID=2952754 RepID=A0A9Q4FSK4_9HYPH|nr:AraC family transcriptional regulator [Devosia ureilytica]MCP8883665.1 AraC family transcriptional regulator [Devosia ureilytica]MCP8887273.1 AraC family transcriptional regulator [Devosia ureilytica]
MQQASIAAGIVSGFVAFLDGQGVDGRALAATAGIAGGVLVDPDARLPFDRYAALVGLAHKTTGDTGLSLRFGAAVGMADLSILGLIMEASATMGEAFVQMQRYGRLALAADPSLPPRFAMEHHGERLYLVDRGPDPDSFPEMTEEAFAQLTCGPRRFLTRPHVLSVHVTHEAPRHAELYAEIFACPVHFGAVFNALELPLDIADWPVARERRYVFGVLCEKAESLLREAVPVASIRALLDAAIRASLHQGEPGADPLARSLGFSRSTLFRRLRDEGTSFARVLDGVRHDLALQYLAGGRSSLAEIAYLLGFSEPAALSRAFQRWTGETPGQYRLRSRLSGVKDTI